MSKIRYREVYTYPEGMEAKDKLPANATIIREPYEVSDEQLAEEVEDAKREELTDKSSRSSKEASELLSLVSKKLGG